MTWLNRENFNLYLNFMSENIENVLKYTVHTYQQINIFQHIYMYQ